MMTTAAGAPCRTLRCDAAQPLRYDVCGRLFSPDGFCHHRRTFDRHVLILLLEGTLHITAGGARREVHAGEYLLLLAGEEHFGHAPSGGRLSYLWLHLCADVAPAPLAAMEGSSFAEWGGVAEGSRLTERFTQLIDMSLDEPGCPQEMMDCACRLLMMELGHMQSGSRAARDVHPAIRSATDWIRSHCHQPFTIPELARHVGYQPDYLSTLFRRCTGQTIVQYANALRIRMAKALLTNFDVTIKEAAYSCGFPDEKYFMRLFRRLEGVTPTQFRSRREK